jgi:uncharacterized membrane protein
MEIKEEYYRAFFRESSDYYLEAVANVQAGRKFTINLAAFFLGILWLLYRKMYRVAGVVFVVTLIKSIVEQNIYRSASLSPQTIQYLQVISGIVVAVILCSIANYLYVLQANRIITETINTYREEEKIIEALHQKGGTSPMVAFLLFVMLIAAYVAVS